MTGDGPARRRWGIIALWVLFCFFEFKQGFVRHTGGNIAGYFVALLGAFLALRWRWRGPAMATSMLGVLLLFALVRDSPPRVSHSARAEPASCRASTLSRTCARPSNRQGR